MKKRKVIIDCDPGADDGVMLAFAAANQDKLEILGVTTVSGNQDVYIVTRNALDLTELFGLDVPVVRGMMAPVLRDAEWREITPEDEKVGGCSLPRSKKKEDVENGILYMSRVLEELTPGEKVTIVATGPLTNIAFLLRIFPEVKDQIEQVVFMGGSLSGGNYTEAAEFNFYKDPEAAEMVFHENIPLVMCGLDVTEKCTLTRKQLLKLCQSGKSAARLCGDMLGFCLENSPEKFRGEISVHDVVPVMYLLHPEIFEGGFKILDVDCSDGPSRGAVLGGFRWWKNEEEETNVYVLTEADREKFQEYLITSLYELA